MRTATGLDVYAYGHSIIARLGQLRAVQMMLNVVKLSAPCLAQSEPGQPGEMTHGSQHPCQPPHSILGASPSRIWAGIFSWPEPCGGSSPFHALGATNSAPVSPGLRPG